MNAIAGISGGRTSALMAEGLDPSVVLSFQNTGREKNPPPRKELGRILLGTLDYIDALEQHLQRPIVRLEFRAPPRGEPPRLATFEIVDHRHLSRKGEPFRDMLECLRTFRAKYKGLGPVAPWPRSRICTAYLKIRTQRKYCQSLGWTPEVPPGGVPGRHLEYVEYVGLRADEPDRVASMRKRNDDLDTLECAPLFDRRIVKLDVLSHWSRMPFDLGIEEHDGNCDGCFLKDERDLADALSGIEDPEWWIDIEENFAPMRRGGRPSYRQVLAEAPERRRLRAAIAVGVDPMTVETSLPKRRVKLIVAQERASRTPFSCSCDAAKAEDYDALIEAA
jgi:hypothetical protein